MNTGFYENLDTNFEQAYEMAIKDFSHEDLIAFLKNGNIPQKQIAALKLTTLKNQNDAKALLANLIGCDGKIREATAVKINKLLLEQPTTIDFLTIEPQKFAAATIDINGNICRLVIDSISILKINKDFSNIYLTKIIEYINESFKELDNFIFRDKKYVINKQLFKLYWCLEALKLFATEINEETLLKILIRAAKEKEYTIREKVAQIVKSLSSSTFQELKQILKNDENYYVRQVF